MVAARTDDSASCGQSGLAVAAAPRGRAVENARLRMKSRVHVVTHPWKFSAGRPTMQACLGIAKLGIPKMRFTLERLRNGRLMKIIRLWSALRRPVEPVQGGCPAGHPVDLPKSTLVRSDFAGFRGRVVAFFRRTPGLSRAVAAGLVAGTALLALTGCITAPSKADVADVIVIAATATANEPAPPCPRLTSRSCKRPASRARPQSRSSSIRPTASPPSSR